MRAVRFALGFITSLALGQVGQQQPVVVIQQPGMIPQQLDIVNAIKPPQVEPLGEAMARARQQRLNEQLQAQQIEQLRLRNERLKGSASTEKKRSAETAKLLSAPDLHTYGFLNGRAWLLLNVDEKQLLMDGAREGIAMVSPDKLPNYSSALLSVDEFQRGVDLFFADPSNVLIPILDAFRAVGLKAAGTGPSEVESLIALMRRTAGAAPERTPARK